MTWWVTDLVIAAVSFAMGYMVCSALNDLTHGGRAMPHNPPDRRRWHSVPSGFVGVLVILLAVATVVVSTVSLDRQGRQVRCQANYNQAFAAAATQAREAAAQDRNAIRDLVQALAPGGGPDTYARARSEFLEQVAQADRKRAQNPYPDLTQVCG